jgi:hypothetical protein
MSFRPLVARENAFPPADEKKCRPCLDKHPRTIPVSVSASAATRFSKRRRWRADPHHHRILHRWSRERNKRERPAEISPRKRNHNLKVRYGITAEGCCAICKRPPYSKRPLVVDHKHGVMPVQVRGYSLHPLQLDPRLRRRVGRDTENNEHVRRAGGAAGEETG